MSIPECHLVRDLLVTYLAGEASPETTVFMESHLSRCPECRAAHAAMTKGTPPPVAPPFPPPVDPGRRLVGRVRRQVTILVAVVVASILLAVGGVVWGVSAIQRWANDPERHPVPASYSVSPVDAAKVDLTPLGLTPAGLDTVPDGAVARFRTAGGQTVTLEFYLHSSPYRARVAYDRWNNQFRVRTMSVQMNTGSVGSARFRSGGHHYHGWHDDRWFIIVDVPDTVPEASALRAEIVQQLGKAWYH